MNSFPIQATAIYAGINVLITLVLAMLVVRQRWATRTSIGDGGKEPLVKAVRAHANNVENVPLALIIIGITELLGTASWFVHGLGILLTVSRLAHALGLSTTTGTSSGRFLGTTGTWIVMLVGAVVCIYHGLTG